MITIFTDALFMTHACRALLKLKGRTEASEAERRVVSGEAWDEFCDTLKAAGAVVLSTSAPRDALNQVQTLT